MRIESAEHETLLPALKFVAADLRGNQLPILPLHAQLAALGRLSIARASPVEADAAGRWFADLAPISGPRLGPFGLRSQALALEQTLLEDRLSDGLNQAEPGQRQ
jgi:hypothetical protein